MPTVPKVIFLYDNDALEVRYSDDSRLELSPCGAAMVFHTPSKPGEHPRYCQSQQVHKRTQFVTSEHRQRVIQALDFRNRFAKRPYLCQELLPNNTQDIVSLYASIDRVKWPKSHTAAMIDILPDGSRKVTSLDDYVSLIVSPHQQDFSVCYLSKLSVENSPQHPPPQSLSPPPGFPYSSSARSAKNGHGKRMSEAIIYPYSHTPNEFTAEERITNSNSNSGNTINVIPNQHVRHNQNNNQRRNMIDVIPIQHVRHYQDNNQGHQNDIQQQHHARQERTNSSKSPRAESKTQLPPPASASEVWTNDNPSFIPAQLNSHSPIQIQMESNSHQPATQVHSNTHPSSTPVQLSSNLSSHVKSNIIHSSPDSNGKFKLSEESRRHDDITDSRCSPLPHEISSISRSSTPDGLRMTIDSDTTLIHDITESEVLQYRQRHSSPTHQSSRLNEIQLPLDKLVEMKSSGSQAFFNCSPPLDNRTDFNLNLKSHNASFDLSIPTRRETGVFSISDKPRSSGPEGERDRPLMSSEACNISTSFPSHSQEDLNITLTNRFRKGEDRCEEIIPESVSQDCPLNASSDFNAPHPPLNASNDFKAPHHNQACKPSMQDDETSDPSNELVHTLSTNQDKTVKVLSNQCRDFDVSAANVQKAFNNPTNQFDSVQLRTPQVASNNCPEIETSSLAGGSSSSREVTEHGTGRSHQKRSSMTSYLHSTASKLSIETDNKSSSKLNYVWTTSHTSKNNCPKEWTHPLMLVLQGDPTYGKGATSQDSQTALKEDECRLTALPQPLPLTCPFQHTHRSTSLALKSQSQDDQNNHQSTSNVGVFQRGRLKVVLSEGIIYRLIQTSGMTVIEIYPGDGTVLISQGAKAFYFTHFIPRDGQLEERMYSVKTLPQRCAKGSLNIEQMLKTARRFLQICQSWDTRSDTRNATCWQKEIVAIVEPLSSSILEECNIDGLGKFTAFSNGRVRVVFDDRTSLDMMSDFSSRLGPSPKTPGNETEEGTRARLLLPSGSYVFAEKHTHGQHAHYLKMANEWVAWVNTSPSERHKFYAQRSQPVLLEEAANLELKKILFFNYILENTFQPLSPHQDMSPSQTAPTSLACQSSNSKLTSSCLKTRPLPQLPTSTLSSGQHTALGGLTLSSGQHTALGGLALETRTAETAMGFLSVKQVLAQTSSLINDIDHFLEKSKR